MTESSVWLPKGEQGDPGPQGPEGPPGPQGPTGGPGPDAATFLAFQSSLLNNSDFAQGAANVGYGGQQLNTYLRDRVAFWISDVSKFATEVSKIFHTVVNTRGYSSSGLGIGGATYVLDPADNTTVQDGVLCFVSGDGGRYKLWHNGSITTAQAGARGIVGTSDSAAISRAINACGPRNIKIYQPFLSPIDSTVTLLDYISMEGTWRGAGFFAMDGTNFETNVLATGKVGIHLTNITSDCNKANRESALTTRTVGIYFVGGSNNKISRCVGKNAIGGGGIPGIGIATAGGATYTDVEFSLAQDCGTSGKAADGFFSSAGFSENTSNVAVNCTDTGHVLESCSMSNSVGCISINCGVVGALTTNTVANQRGLKMIGLQGLNWTAGVTGGVQLGVYNTGNLYDCKLEATLTNDGTSAVGPGINVRRTGTGRMIGLSIEATVRGGTTQGIVVDSAQDIVIKNPQITSPAAGCIQFNGDATGVVNGGKCVGGTFGIVSSSTSNIKVNGTHAVSQTSYNFYALDTSTMTCNGTTAETPGVGYYGKDAGATMRALTQTNGALLLPALISGAPTGSLSNRHTVVNGPAAANQGVIPLYTA